MKTMFLITTLAIVVLRGVPTAAAELPAFELRGFSITSHQVAVVGGTGVQEQAATPALTFHDMPASPHQIAVLTRRLGPTTAATVSAR